MSPRSIPRLTRRPSRVLLGGSNRRRSGRPHRSPAAGARDGA
jgi:hypothetical protein